MNRLMRGLKVALGLCLLALGVFGASAAQAAPHWNVNGSELGTGTNKALKASLPKPGILTTGIGGNKVEFTCPKGELVGGVSLKGGNPGGELTNGKVKFSECTTVINGSAVKACEPNNNGTEPGVIVTNEGKGRLTEHSTGEGVTIVESTVEETVAGVKQPVFGRVKSSAECSIGSNIPIIGPRLAAVDVGGMTGLLTEATSHNIKEFSTLTEIWALSKTVEHKATLGASEAKVELVSGEKWSGKL